MKDLLEMLSERSSIKKILAVIGIAGFLAGSIASIYNLRTMFFSSIPDYRGSIYDANSVEILILLLNHMKIRLYIWI